MMLGVKKGGFGYQKHELQCFYKRKTTQKLNMFSTTFSCVKFHFAGKHIDDPLVMFGDIAVPDGLQNADPCTARGCLWPKARDGRVYVPYRIANQFCKSQQPVPFWRQALSLICFFKKIESMKCL